ncbi:MAG: serine dehydratase subunit alpha family protein [Desulfobacterales bacterium]|nr:serine dehydratase subunit alpha family protein [Desulfobacterales bacterium]MCP4163916.1 serine dehydratase subunit alpha family protein [Deltaproteobacteria bacterium]
MSYSVKDILRMEVAPALGCTEPAAIALCVASAKRLLKIEGEPDLIEIWLDPNIYKNGLAVIIPGTEGLFGLDMAAALGFFGGDPDQSLEVLETIDENSIKKSKELIAANKVKVNLLKDQRGIFIRASIIKGKEISEASIEKVHDNITSLKINGKETIITNPDNDSFIVKNQIEDLEKWLKNLAFSNLLKLIDDLDQEDLDFIEKGIHYNIKLADYGLKHGSGMGVGKALDRLVRQKLLAKDMMLASRILTSSAADARMGGIKLPAMSSAGSGNHGLTAVLPICAVADFVESNKQNLLKAIGLSHLVTGFIKAHTGRLSAICGCSVAAGAGATAGITYLMGGDIKHIAGAIKNLTVDLAGVICDGANKGCALKLATAASTAVQSALFSLHGVNVESEDGITGHSTEKTLENIGILSTEGMIETDRTILKIMLEKEFK